jgi:hypothetical protein
MDADRTTTNFNLLPHYRGKLVQLAIQLKRIGRLIGGLHLRLFLLSVDEVQQRRLRVGARGVECGTDGRLLLPHAQSHGSVDLLPESR